MSFQLEVDTVYRTEIHFWWEESYPKNDQVTSKDELVFQRTPILDGVYTTDVGRGPCWNPYVVIEAASKDLVERQARLFLREIKRWRDYRLGSCPSDLVQT